MNLSFTGSAWSLLACGFVAFALLSVILGIIDRKYSPLDSHGNSLTGAPWRRFIAMTRESAARLAESLWRMHRFFNSKASIGENILGFFLTLVWLLTLALNYAVVAQILDIFIPSADTISLPGVGDVGQAAAWAAPIIILVELVAGIAFHNACKAWMESKRKELLVGLLATLAFAVVLVILETMGAWFRGEVTGGFNGLSDEGKYGPFLSGIIGFSVCVAEMYAGAEGWDRFIENAIASLFYRTQSLILWMATFWMYILAGKRYHVIHPQIVKITDDLKNQEDAVNTNARQLITHKAKLGELEQNYYRIQNTTDLMGINELEKYVISVIGRDDVMIEEINKFRDWLLKFQSERNDLPSFTSNRELSLQRERYALNLSFSRVDVARGQFLINEANQNLRRVSSWRDLMTSERISDQLKETEDCQNKVMKMRRAFIDLPQSINNLKSDLSQIQQKLILYRPILAEIESESQRWRDAITILQNEIHGYVNVTVQTQKEALEADHITDPNELLANQAYVDRAFVKVKEINEKINSLEADCNDMTDTINQLIKSDWIAKVTDEVEANGEKLDQWMRNLEDRKRSLEQQAAYLNDNSSIGPMHLFESLIEDWKSYINQDGMQKAVEANVPKSSRKIRKPLKSDKS